MNKGSNFLNIISKLIGIFDDYHKIKQDDVLRPKSKMFGVRSIVLSCIGMLLVALFGNLTIRAIIGLQAGNIAVLLYIFFLFVLVIIDIYVLGYFVIYPLICWILQINLNKRPVGWIALALWILLLIVVFGSFFIVSKVV